MSEDDVENVRVTHLVPEHIRDAAKAQTEHGELSERVREVYKQIAIGDAADGAEAVRAELEQIRAQKDTVRAKIQELQQDLAEIEQRETRLEERLTDQRSRQERYEGLLEALEETLYDGGHVDPGHAIVTRAAGVIGKPPEEVLEDLKERNPAIPSYAFVEKRNADQEWTGVDEEVPRDE